MYEQTVTTVERINFFGSYPIEAGRAVEPRVVQTIQQDQHLRSHHRAYRFSTLPHRSVRSPRLRSSLAYSSSSSATFYLVFVAAF